MNSEFANKKEHWFIFQNDLLLIRKNNPELFLPPPLLTQLKNHFFRQFSLGIFNATQCFCAELMPNILIPSEIELISLRKSFSLFDQHWYDALVKAYSVINWDRNHQFCSRCGKPTDHTPHTFERICSNCNLFFYPRISPSIIVLIKKEHQILMARSPHFHPGTYGLIAGFVEVGESIEQAVHREVKEEVNIQIKNLQYFGSQPWPFPDSLMMGFIAEYDSGEIIIDTKEIEHAGWYSKDNLPGYPSSSISIAKKLIDYFIVEQTKPTKKT